MDINGSGTDALMSHKGFQREQICTVLVMISGKSMPEGMAGKTVIPAQFFFMGTVKVRDPLMIDRFRGIPLLWEKPVTWTLPCRDGIPVQEDKLPGLFRKLCIPGGTVLGSPDEDPALGVLDI